MLRDSEESETALRILTLPFFEKRDWERGRLVVGSADIHIWHMKIDILVGRQMWLSITISFCTSQAKKTGGLKSKLPRILSNPWHHQRNVYRIEVTNRTPQARHVNSLNTISPHIGIFLLFVFIYLESFSNLFYIKIQHQACISEWQHSDESE